MFATIFEARGASSSIGYQVSQIVGQLFADRTTNVCNYWNMHARPAWRDRKVLPQPEFRKDIGRRCLKPQFVGRPLRRFLRDGW